MAYDEHLAARIRDLLAGEPDLTQRAMFGGLGFMLAGNMAVAAGSDGGVMVRVDPADAADHRATGLVTAMVMRGNEMAGWMVASAHAIEEDADLARIVGWGVAYVRTLPPKPPKPLRSPKK